jgi:hypothetical protein
MILSNNSSAVNNGPSRGMAGGFSGMSTSEWLHIFNGEPVCGYEEMVLRRIWTVKIGQVIVGPSGTVLL